MSEVSDLRDIFFNKLEKTSYGRNEIKKLFDDCYFSIHSEQNNQLNNKQMNKIITNIMSSFYGNNSLSNILNSFYGKNSLSNPIRHNIKDIELSEHFFNHKDNFISMFKDVTLTYTDTDIDIYYCNEHNLRIFKIIALEPEII